MEDQTREYEGATQSFLHWNVERNSYLDLIELYISQLEMMGEHTFMAIWNYCQSKQAKNNLITGELLLVHDFAQSYLCLLQNELQGMHCDHKQVFMHPTVAYYNCSNDLCNKLVTHEIVHVSDDLKHDAHLVKRFHT